MTDFLTDAELSQIRTEFLDLLPDTCHILRDTATNSSGNTVYTEGTAVANAACRVDPYKQTGAQMTAGQEANRNYFQLTLKWDVDVRNGDRILYDSKRYEIIQLHDQHSKRAVTRALVARIGE